MNEPIITICGNVASDPDLRYSPQGTPVVKFSLASTPRSKERGSEQWVDGTTLWVRVTAFRSDAENAAESLTKGTRVVVTGRLSQEDWTDKEGAKRVSMNLIAEEIGVSTKWSVVTSRKADRSGTARPAAAAPKPEYDPWASSPATEEPPF